MSAQVQSTNTDQATAAATTTTTARKDWREICAQKRAKRSARYLKTGRIHEDVNEAQHIWGANIQTATKPGGEQGKEHSFIEKVSLAVAASDPPHIVSPSTVAYSSIWSSCGTWGGISTALQDAGAINAADDRSNYPTRWENNGWGKESVPTAASATTPFQVAKRVHHRTSSTSTASSSSLRTEDIADWWEANSPWAWQWAGVDTCRK